MGFVAGTDAGFVGAGGAASVWAIGTPIQNHHR